MNLKNQELHDEISLADIDAIINIAGGAPKNIMEILHAIQNKYRYLPEEALRHVSNVTDITPAQIAGVSTFYSQFRHRPVGKHIIKVCFGTACYVRGAERIDDGIRNYLGIGQDEDTDPKRVFTVERVACIGCCSLAPCLMIDEVTYGYLTPQNVHKSVDSFLKEYGT